MGNKIVTEADRKRTSAPKGVEGFELLVGSDGPSAVDITRAHQPDLIVLDVMLPGFDGVEVCRQIRQFSNAYVLMLTTRTEEIDKIVGLAVGADD